MSDASAFLKQYSDMPDFKIHGNDRYIASFTQERFPNEIRFDKRLINVGIFDIETAYVDGFADCSTAQNPILTIAYKSSRSPVYHLWGTKLFDSADSKYSPCEYHHFRDEETMLLDFLKFWSEPENTPDVITGWNIEFFDIPYLVNRLTRLFGINVAQRLSPWNRIEERKTTVKGREETSYDIYGVEVLDYLPVFVKFTVSTYGAQETYKLDYIAGVVLEDAKEDYSDEGSLQSLWENDFQKFGNYNIKDVDIIKRFDEKLRLFDLIFTIAYMGGVNYKDTLGSTFIWDSIIYRRIMKDGMVPPKVNSTSTVKFAGGYVKDVSVGLHEWVMSFDVNAMYPSALMQYNMSPETILNESDRLHRIAVIEKELETRNVRSI